MPWSGKHTYSDDLLAPMEEISIDYAGKNPFLICTVAMRLLRDTLKVSASSLREDDVRWDITGDPKGFYVKWRAYRPEDKWSKTMIIIIAQGFIDKERVGKVNIRIRGYLNTSYKYGNPISKYLWWFYSYIFYWKQRRAYLDFSRDNIMHIRQEILSAYNILKEERWGG